MMYLKTEKMLLSVNKAISNALKALPSAQPESCDDTISRKAAIDAIHNADTQIYEGEAAVGRRNYMTKEECCEIIDGLPFAQPEIIYCRGCKHFNDYFVECDHESGLKHIKDDHDHCSYAERRTE